MIPGGKTGSLEGRQHLLHSPGIPAAVESFIEQQRLGSKVIVGVKAFRRRNPLAVPELGKMLICGQTGIAERLLHIVNLPVSVLGIQTLKLGNFSSEVVLFIKPFGISHVFILRRITES